MAAFGCLWLPLAAFGWGAEDREKKIGFSMSCMVAKAA